MRQALEPELPCEAEDLYGVFAVIAAANATFLALAVWLDCGAPKEQ
jgi:hypothetical protein